MDVEHLGTPRVIGTWIVDDEVLVDPGPASSLPRLLRQLDGWRPKVIALTHIHLDHAGATGALVQRHCPRAEVWVHESGAHHLVDPSRLLRSARNVYGAALDQLWGGLEAVPEAAIRALGDRQRRGPFEIVHTPGHATHHVSYLHRRSRTAFVGDIAGVRIAPGGPVLAPTVPPSFDPALWLQSLERVAAWRPAALAVTHFGRHSDVDGHLAAIRHGLEAMVATGGSAPRVAEHVAELLRGAGGATAAYEQAAQPQTFPAGIRRYLDTGSGRSSDSAPHQQHHASAR